MKFRVDFLTATTAAIGLAVAPSASAQSDHINAVQSLMTQAGGEICTAVPQNPHRSSGARDGRILFKTRVTCEGTYPEVTVTIHGSLQEGPRIGPKWIATTSVQTQVVRTGGTATFYTPLPSGKQVTAAGSYTGFISGQITAPVPGSLAEGNTQTVVIK